MGYLGNYRDLGQAAAEIQARLPAQLHARCGAAGRAARHWPSDSDSPFRLRPNDAVPSGLYGHPASARRATARRGRKLSALLAALLFAASGAAQATIINALTPSLFDVTNAISSAVDGDTVIIPAGTATWTSSLVITKAITLIGQTTTDSVAGTANDKTTIVYNLTVSQPMIQVKSVSGKSYRISGFTFQDISTTQNAGGCMSLGGQSQSVRVDHCHFTTMPYQAVYIFVGGTVYGVADHNLIVPARTQCFLLYNGNAPAGSTNDLGNGVWAQSTGWGGPNFFVIEDNYIQHASGTGQTSITDGTQGCKFVFRHNHVYDLWMANHGTEGAVRGGRACEIYNNDFHNTLAQQPGGIRSGGLLLYNNTWGGTALSNAFSISAFRIYTQFNPQWGGAAGNGPWDVNDTEGNKTYVASHAPHQYYPATVGTWATVASGSHTQIVDSTNPGWTLDEWVSFGVVRKSDGAISYINATTNGNTLGLDNAAVTGGPASMIWAAGDQYQIFKVLAVLDQTGRGPGDLITGPQGSFINSVTGTKAWPHEVLEPAYGWNNLYGTTPIKIGCGAGAPFLENREFYNQAAAVSGVQRTGVGVGTFANRPASGAGGNDITGITLNPPGTAYWATDVPSINGSTDKGALYVWRGGAWALYYQPYTYPHPLVSGVPSAGVPSAPTNLRVVN